MGERYDVFVSYGHADEVWVRALVENLHAAELRVFFDDWEIAPGDRWVERLEDGVAGSVAAVVVCSPASLERPWVRDEYEALLRRSNDEGLRLVPVVIGEVVLPPFLGNRHYVDFRGTGGDEAAYRVTFEALLRGLRGQRGPRPAGEARTPGGLVVPAGGGWRPEGPREATLRLSADEVVFAPVGGQVARGRPAGVDHRLRDGLFELVRARRLAPAAVEAVERVDRAGGAAGHAAGLAGRLTSAGVLLGERFLPEPVAAAVAAEVQAAARLGASLELAVEVDDPALADLPWETLVVPGMAHPLVLHPQVRLYRAVPGLGPTPLPTIPGPLRILAAVASPERGTGLDLLDYEQELAKILDAVEVARQAGRAYVEVVTWGSLAEIRAALARQRFHVLHISCHAQPGALVLETADGRPDLVDAARFADEALLPDRGVGLVVLAGCSTAQAGAGGTGGTGAQATGEQAAAQEDQEPPAAVAALPGLARGVPAVLAMTASVTDRYATALASRLYAELAGGQVADPLAALAAARRQLEDDRRRLPEADPARGLVEWATPTLLLRGPARPLYDPKQAFAEVRPSGEPVFAEGMVVRRVGAFVGRRGELRGLLAALRSGTTPGAVVRGIGGVGKSTLAAQLVAGLGEQAGLVVSLAGPATPDLILDTAARRLRSAALRQPPGLQQRLLTLAGMVGETSLPWAERVELLVEHLLPTLPVLLLLDNFEDNQASPAGGDPAEVRDPHLAAFLTRWTDLHRHARLLVTSRYPLHLPGEAHRGLAEVHLGPLSLAEARKLVWRLPALDRLTPAELRRAVADVGGHPRALEYLDALLAGGRARFADVDRRLRAALAERAEVADPEAWLDGRAGDLDRALDETVTLAAADVLLDALLARVEQVPLAGRLLRGAAVYRLPVDDTGLAWQVGDMGQPVADPDRQARLAELSARIRQARAADPQAGVDDMGLSPADRAQLDADLAAERRPPLVVPAGLDAATRLVADLGLLTPAPLADGGAGMVVHRWTAAALARTTEPAALAEAHRRAAAYWAWRVEVLPQPRIDDVVHLLEAAHHQLAAGDTDAAAWTTNTAWRQLHTWGAYDWGEQTWRELLPHLPGRTKGLSVAHANLAILAQLRGDYPAAETRYQQALTIDEELGDRDGLAATYSNLGILAQLRGDYPGAEARYQQALAIGEELGDRAGLATTYGNLYTNLGVLARLRGDYPAAETRHQQALAIREELGDRAGLAITSTNLGQLARLRGDYPGAEARYQQALAIFEELGDRAGLALTYTSLGVLARLRGDYPGAEARYQQALAIFEELGDRAGLATTYENIGNLAQLRGDYPGAE
ncbi:tetratricopeptide repeat protein, partial [Frankia sp. CiP3]|uniref:tetratricopeptide repeat protein n=1 Tax=Frankia sp. CiP3 TaxID=2880971 RepID=UPI001EF73EA9